MIRPIWEIEREAIIEALEECRGCRTKAARALEISLRSLRVKIRQYQAQGFDIPEADGKYQYGTYGKAQNERPAPLKCFEGVEEL